MLYCSTCVLFCQIAFGSLLAPGLFVLKYPLCWGQRAFDLSIYGPGLMCAICYEFALCQAPYRQREIWLA